MSSGDHLGDHNGDVVATAMRNGLVDESVGDRGDVLALHHHTRDLRARQFVEQTVTTDDEAICLLKSERFAVDLDVACDTQCSGEDPVMGVSRGVSLPQLPTLDELGRHAVVPGQLGQRPLTPQIGTAVADIDERKASVFEESNR